MLVAKYGKSQKGKSVSKETRDKQSKSRLGKNMIPITQYSVTGEFIKNWPSTKDAAIALNIKGPNITGCLKNFNKTIGGFKWKYSNQNL